MRPSPYEYYDNKLGVKMSFLISDRTAHPDSINVIAYNALYKRTKSNACTEKQLRRASLNYEALIQFSTLPQDWKDMLVQRFGNPKEEAKKSWFASHYEHDRKAFDFYAAYRLGEDSRKLDTALVERYTYNASVLNTVIKIKANRKAYMKSLGCTQIDIWESLSNDVNAFREVDHALPATSRGLRMKVKDYQERGYEAVISGRLLNQNAAKVKEDEQSALLEELLAKHTNLDNAQVASLYNAVAARVEGWKTITPQTVGNIKEEKALVIYAGRNGKNALIDNKLMQNRRSAPKLPMLYWTMDGWDAELLYQKTEIIKGSTTVTYHNRLTMVAVLDPFNKYIVGYSIGTHETPALIKEALRNAMQHVRELFGEFYRPYQLQSDRYAIKTLTPAYEAVSIHYTPARVKNKKAKVIEPWFNRFNKEYCQMFDNWSGHNVDSGSANQPNEEVLNQIRHSFPDEQGCRLQLISSIEQDRAKNREAFVAKWQEVPAEYQSILPFETYLQYLGVSTGYTNRLNGAGLLPTINGMERCYDSFDINFRKLAHLDWVVKYDPSDLSKVLVINAESKGGKAVKEVGTYQFVLQEKYMQPMALAERNKGDAMHLQEVKQYNNEAMQYITDEREENARVLDSFFQSKPELNDTLAKLLIVNSKGQHKDPKNSNRLGTAGRELIEAATVEETKDNKATWQQQQREYHEQKVDITEYL